MIEGESANEIMAAALEFLDKRREPRRRRQEAEEKARKERDEMERKAVEEWIAKRMAEKGPGEPIAPDYVPLPGSQVNIFGYPIDNIREAMGMAPSWVEPAKKMLETAKGQFPVITDEDYNRTMHVLEAQRRESMRKLDAMEEYYRTQFRPFDYRKDKPEPTFGDGGCFNRPFLLDITPELMQMDWGYIDLKELHELMKGDEGDDEDEGEDE